ncbi:DUF4145 domain-containing protein [Listeria booriae]|uniref:DUF4145 domain-containing protein n=1 Tax=Listeria booriae TaxID=1552123 RepID=A0A7X0YMQ3_9LIST|nr:DUF4145 domain-containing protein [Listeria booriae]MBC2117199.1 DUF4145 domain-containing protein [Listeria booriae]
MSTMFSNKNIQPVFTCPYCTKISSHNWESILENHYAVTGIGAQIPSHEIDKIVVAQCNLCHEKSYWFQQFDNVHPFLVYPKIAFNIDLPNNDMPRHIQDIYNEAALIADLSFGASASLSRLALEKLLIHLDYKNGRLVDKIDAIMADGKLSTESAIMMQAIRHDGNVGTHEGSINLQEDGEIPKFLLDSLNTLVDELITKPKVLSARLDKLPDAYKKGITTPENL